MNRKKELKEQYKQMRPQMGIFMISSSLSNKCYLEATPNLTGKINGTKFKLGAGGHPNRELQKDWKELGETNFKIEILENLEYDKDETKTDYTEELVLLQMIWEEKISKEKRELYKK